MANSSDPTTLKTEDQLKEESWFGFPMKVYQGFWCLNVLFEGVTSFQNNFEAKDSDIILASLPKTGTTWLKSLLFAIVNRNNLCGDLSKLPFHTKTPHEIVLHLEIEVYKNFNGTPPDNILDVPSPRLFATHMPYLSLPDSIKGSKCRIVYVSRNPLDTFVSIWHFYLQFEISKGVNPSKEMMEEYLGKYCTGVSPFGPYEDHLLGYWKETQKNPKHVLFLEYEGLKKEPKAHLKRLAEFVGCPFSEEEDKKNVIDEIIELCSIKSMKEMEVNKTGKFYPWVENKALFRKGEVGDWNNHLTTSMAKGFHQMLQKLPGWFFFYILSTQILK
ncbi:cytosolic sulfotransferase 5-like [Spinacia oleracea]|uniref:Sulfotransferase n=1 Tax=Spinacia oleracea TaxID=3562 RepID=A0A9R0JLF4_SPIOL|nr:cytosolic sulfotransferase 5-like [Spinacia oleracea]